MDRNLLIFAPWLLGKSGETYIKLKLAQKRPRCSSVENACLACARLWVQFPALPLLPKKGKGGHRGNFRSRHPKIAGTSSVLRPARMLRGRGVHRTPCTPVRALLLHLLCDLVSFQHILYLCKYIKQTFEIKCLAGPYPLVKFLHTSGNDKHQTTCKVHPLEAGGSGRCNSGSVICHLRGLEQGAY